MSIHTYRLPFLQRSPRVWGTSECLYARTNLWFRFLNLFSYSRTVLAHRPSQNIFITVRWLWVLRRVEIIPFEFVRAIDRISWNVPGQYSIVAGFTDETEIWYVRLLLKSDKPAVNIFRFVGDDLHLTSWKGINLSSNFIVDCEGTQDNKSQTYAEILANFIGVECHA